jgi:hypothetical protein
LWVRTWGGVGPDVGTGIAVEGDGNIVVTGSGTSFGAGSYDDIILEYSPAGVLLSQKTWGGTGHDNSGANISLDGGGNWLLAGDTDGFGVQYYDMLINKYSPAGDLQWTRTWGGANMDSATGINADALGNIYVGGYTDSFGDFDTDSFLLKYSANGDLIWQRTWGVNDPDYSQCLATNAAGYSYLGTLVYDIEADNYAVEIAKYSPEGDLLWQSMWSDSTSRFGLGIALGGSGSIYMVGYSKGGAAGSWSNPIGVSEIVNGAQKSPIGTTNALTATQTSPTGSERSPVGITDSGGGLEDIMIMKMRDQ